MAIVAILWSTRWLRVVLDLATWFRQVPAKRWRIFVGIAKDQYLIGARSEKINILLDVCERATF